MQYFQHFFCSTLTGFQERGVGDWDVGLGRILLAAKEKVWSLNGDRHVRNLPLKRLQYLFLRQVCRNNFP